jgi:hypothetical protein
MITILAMAIVGTIFYWKIGLFPAIVAMLITWKVVDTLGMVVIRQLAKKGYFS